MDRVSGSAVMRLGPLARRLLARRRRWLRWAAVGLMLLTLSLAAAQLLHRPAPRRPVASRSVPTRTPAPHPIGVADVVPPGMRAVNLIVPASSSFGGRLAPWSRVDVLAAFDVGTDRAVRRVVAGAIVLHVAPQLAASAGVSAPLSGLDGRLGAAAVAEIALAVPAARERDIVLAQAFGRVFLAVDPASRALVSPGGDAWGSDSRSASSTDAALSLRPYLGLTAGPASAAAVPGWIAAPAGVAPVVSWPAPRIAPGRPLEFTRNTAPSTTPTNLRRGANTVELIEGTEQRLVEVSP